jgi:hypothetical protein
MMMLLGGLAPVASFAQDVQDSAGNPSSPGPARQGLDSLDPVGQRAVHNAIPFTPEMIQELQRRYGAAQQAEEQATQQIASPVSRMVSAAFAVTSFGSAGDVDRSTSAPGFAGCRQLSLGPTACGRKRNGSFGASGDENLPFVRPEPFGRPTRLLRSE